MRKSGKTIEELLANEYGLDPAVARHGTELAEKAERAEGMVDARRV